jgi:HAMP domain-containing protein
VKFRSKIFLAIIIPSSALVAAVVGAGLARVTRDNEERELVQVSRTREAFEATLLEQLDQLKTLSAPFKGSRFDAAISEAVASGDIAGVQQQLDYQFQLLGRVPDFYELRDRSGKILLRKSHAEKSATGPLQKWVLEREEALTEFDGRPYLAIRFEHEKGTLVIGNQVTKTLDRLKKSFGIDLALVGPSGPVYSSLRELKASAGLEGTVYAGKTRYLAQQGAPKYSELTPIYFLADMSSVDEARVVALVLGAGGLAVAFLVGLLVSVLVSRGMSKPIESLVEASRKIAAGDYKVKVDVSTRDEIGRLAGAFNDMTDGLRKRQEIMDKTLSRDVAEEFL